MKNQINISNLTPEQIEEVRQQLKALDEQPISIMDKVKSWEDAKNIINPEFWIESFGEIEHDVRTVITKNNIPSEKHAKSILATCQLMVIAEALNEGDEDNRVAVHLINGELRAFHYQEHKFQIMFKNIPTAEHTINQFPELWYDYFMIDKPTKQ